MSIHERSFLDRQNNTPSLAIGQSGGVNPKCHLSWSLNSTLSLSLLGVGGGKPKLTLNSFDWSGGQVLGGAP